MSVLRTCWHWWVTSHVSSSPWSVLILQLWSMSTLVTLATSVWQSRSPYPMLLSSSRVRGGGGDVKYAKTLLKLRFSGKVRWDILEHEDFPSQTADHIHARARVHLFVAQLGVVDVDDKTNGRDGTGITAAAGPRLCHHNIHLYIPLLKAIICIIIEFGLKLQIE